MTRRADTQWPSAVHMQFSVGGHKDDSLSRQLLHHAWPMWTFNIACNSGAVHRNSAFLHAIYGA